MRKIEVQLRNRESQQSSEVLMSALAAMQDKNATLEKNLSAETRVKLDLFSALGDARRQLEIASCEDFPLNLSATLSNNHYFSL